MAVPLNVSDVSFWGHRRMSSVSSSITFTTSANIPPFLFTERLVAPNTWQPLLTIRTFSWLVNSQSWGCSVTRPKWQRCPLHRQRVLVSCSPSGSLLWCCVSKSLKAWLLFTSVPLQNHCYGLIAYAVMHADYWAVCPTAISVSGEARVYEPRSSNHGAGGGAGGGGSSSSSSRNEWTHEYIK